MRVVIADAMKARLEYTRQVMQRLGFTIVASGNDGIWAVSFCRKYTPDLAIIDDDLPQLAADRVVAAIRRDESAKYIIVGAAGNKPSGTLDKHTLFVPKPFTVGNVGEAVQKLKSGIVVPAVARPVEMPEFGMSRAPQLPHR